MAGGVFDYDVIVVGSGFGGSVAALRATEKGYKVAVMESGKRWTDEEIPTTSWDLRKFMWQPEAEMYGVQRMELLDDVLILCGAGIGGRVERVLQHAVRASEEVLRCSGMGGDHRLGRCDGAICRSGVADAGGGARPV